MTLFEHIDNELYQRESGWWDRLKEVIPELEPLADTIQPPEYHAEGDVAVHTRLAVETCPDDCDPDLLWVALLHDIGKPETTERTETGRITAYGHDKLGAEIALRILDRLEMPAGRRDRIIWAIRHHTFHHSWQLTEAEKLTNKQRKYMLDPDFPLLLEFLRIDSLASQGNPLGLDSYNFYKNLFESIK